MPEDDTFDELDPIDESKTTLAELHKAEGDSMIYVYDVGEDWHEIVLETVAR